MPRLLYQTFNVKIVLRTSAKLLVGLERIPSTPGINKLCQTVDISMLSSDSFKSMHGGVFISLQVYAKSVRISKLEGLYAYIELSLEKISLG